MTSAILRSQLENSLAARIPAAFSRKICPAPEKLPSGIREVDELLEGGIPRGGFTEISGPVSTGRTSMVLAVLAKVTQKSACAWVDVHDTLDPESAAACGADLERLLWLRMSGKVPQRFSRPKDQKPWTRLDQALKATDLLLQAGGFCLVVLDMSDVRAEDALRVPLASWYRFRLAAAQAQTALILMAQTTCAKSSASLVLRCEGNAGAAWTRSQAEKALFEKTGNRMVLERQRGAESSFSGGKKSPRSAIATWTGETLWAR